MQTLFIDQPVFDYCFQLVSMPCGWLPFVKHNSSKIPRQAGLLTYSVTGLDLILHISVGASAL